MLSDIKPAQGTHTLAEIDKYLDMVPEHERKKYGGSYVSPDSKLYFFATEEDATTFAETKNQSLVLAGPFPIGGGTGSGIPEAPMDGKTYGRKNGEWAEFIGGGGAPGETDFRFTKVPSGNSIYINGKRDYDATFRVISLKDGAEYDAMVAMSVTVYLNNTENKHNLGSFPANADFTVTIPQSILPNGCRIQFEAVGRSGSAVTSWYNVTKETLSVTAEGEWWTTPFRANEEKFIPLALTGSQYNLVCEITNKSGYQDSVTIPSTNTGASYNLSFTNPVLKGGASGVYHLRIYLESTVNNAVRSDELSFDVVCVSQETGSAYLVCNDFGSNFKNYTTARMFKYAVVGVGSHNVRFVAKVGSTTIADTGNQTTAAGNIIDYNLSVEVETQSPTFNVDITAYLDDNQVSSTSHLFANQSGYNAVSGAALTIRMNGRSNEQSNRETLINSTGNNVTPTWTNVGFYGADGYVTVDAGNNTAQTSLRLLSGSSMRLPFSKLLSSNCTLELDFKLSNIMDYNAPIIQCKSGQYGLEITPSTIVLTTASASTYDDQVVNYDSEDRCHITIVCRKKPSGVTETEDNYSAVLVYINGCIQRGFAADDMPDISSITFGNSSDVDTADIDLYGIRLYNRSFSRREVEQNAANWNPTNAEKAAFASRNNLRDGDSVNFEIVKTLCRCIVFTSDSLPDRTWEKGQTVRTGITTYDGGEKADDYFADVEWQGTTSHEYLRQNFKWSHNGTKMCAKKNFASSMQSHKMGSVLAYTAIAQQCGVLGKDERASIWQDAYVGFQQLSDGSMRYIGLYTVGPDKGDKGTFGFVSGKSVALEALDNEPLAANFRLPWIIGETCYADDTNETYIFYGVGDNTYTDIKSWEDSMKNADGVAAKWVPAYNFVYNCSQTIKPIESLSALNALNARENYGTDFWIPDGTVYYYNARERQWKPNGKNVFRDEDAGKVTKQSSDNATNEAIKKARRDYFREHVGEYFDKQFALFHLGFIEFFAGKDNLTKNTYPYIKDATDENALVKWRQDDLDTIMDIENRGKSVALYCVEIGDNYSTYGRPSQAVFNGTGNQFWYLIRECFGVDNDGREQGGEYFQFMQSKFIPAILTCGGSSENDSVLRAMAFFDKFYFDRAQNYFPEALYNEDARYCYEAGHLTEGYQHQATSLSQMLGNHLSAERYWLKMRFIYMSSKYLTNKFALASQDDVFATRPYSPGDDGKNVYEVTPAIYMYPSIQQGNTLAERGNRIYPGNPDKTATFQLVSSDDSDMSQRINGMSYIRSLGRMYRNYFKESISITGRMLKELSLGSRSDISNIHSTITGVTISTATSLRVLDISNIPTLGGNIDMQKCLNLREVYARNTQLSKVAFCDGGSLERLELPATITELELHGKKSLTTFTIDGTSNINSVDVINCNAYAVGKALDIIKTFYA